MILYVINLALASALVLGMLTLVASAMVGAIAVGALWLLLPLSLYVFAFWTLAQMARDM